MDIHTAGQTYEAYVKGEYEKAFLIFGDSASCFDRADEAMMLAEYGVWEDFYKNDCLADVRYTGHMIRKIEIAISDGQIMLVLS